MNWFSRLTIRLKVSIVSMVTVLVYLIPNIIMLGLSGHSSLRHYHLYKNEVIEGLFNYYLGGWVEFLGGILFEIVIFALVGLLAGSIFEWIQKIKVIKSKYIVASINISLIIIILIIMKVLMNNIFNIYY